jgi:hypothetical protein
MMFVVPEYPQIADEMARGDVPIPAPSGIEDADFVSSFEPVSADSIDFSFTMKTMCWTLSKPLVRS